MSSSDFSQAKGMGNQVQSPKSLGAPGARGGGGGGFAAGVRVSRKRPKPLRTRPPNEFAALSSRCSSNSALIPSQRDVGRPLSVLGSGSCMGNPSSGGRSRMSCEGQGVMEGVALGLPELPS